MQQADIKKAFENKVIGPNTELVELKHIGSYLYDNLKRVFSPNTKRLTIRMFANRIKNLPVDILKSKLQTGLQNRRNNQCVNSGNGAYHVSDFNQKAYESLIALIKVMKNREDGYNLGESFTFNNSSLRIRRRDQETKQLPCLGRELCAVHKGDWHNELCQPPTNAIGFEGVLPFSGQKLINRKNMTKRGTYVSSRNSIYLWRKPERMDQINLLEK